MPLFRGIYTAPSWQTFTDWACGWALARDRHPITTYLWLTGATAVKRCSRFSVFLGCPLDDQRWHLWGTVIRRDAHFVHDEEVIRVICDDSPKKKVGHQIAGSDRYRHGAGSACQGYRTLRGLHFVFGSMPLPLKWWPAHRLSVPVGFERSLKPEQAPERNAPPLDKVASSTHMCPPPRDLPLATAKGVHQLIRDMWQWIVGELREVGIEVTKSTASPYRMRPAMPPSPTWKTFLRHHGQDKEWET